MESSVSNAGKKSIFKELRNSTLTAYFYASSSPSSFHIMSPDELPSDKHGRPSYTLTNSQRRYLKTGDPGTQSKSQMEARIQDKIELLGDRIEHLLADVELLHSQDYLSEDYWEEALLGLLGFEESPVSPTTRRKWVKEFAETPDNPRNSDIQGAYEVSSPNGSKRPISGPSELSRDFGIFAREILLTPPDVEQDEVLEDMAYGFVEGLYFDHRPVGMGSRVAEQRREYVGEVITALKQRLEHELVYDREWSEWHRKMGFQSDFWTQHKTRMEASIREILKDEPAPIRPRLTRLGFRDQLDSEQKRPDENKRGIYCPDLLNVLLAQNVESDYHPGSAGLWADFQAKFGPGEQFDPEEFVTCERVESLIDDWRIFERTILKEYCKEDSERLEDKTVRGVNATDIVKALHENKTPLNSKAIARLIGSEASYQGQVTQICTDLAGRKWSERPVIRGDKDSWEFTNYGQLLTQSILESSSSPLIYTFSPDIETEVIIKAASEIGEQIDRE